MIQNGPCVDPEQSPGEVSQEVLDALADKITSLPPPKKYSKKNK